MNVGFSTCPNDTFLFYAWVHGKVGKPITPHYHDIETLNTLSYPLFKCSMFSAFNRSLPILPVGGALGFGVGPLLVGKNPLKRVALPGMGTVAHLLFNLFFPTHVEKVFTTYDQIMPMILQGKVDGGVLIHESRFIYQSLGLELLLDLGRCWEQQTSLPLPLGAFTAERGIDSKEIVKTLQESISYAQDYFEEAFPYIQSLSQEKDRSMIEKHIGLYVNDESYALSALGKRAIIKLFKCAYEKGFLQEGAALRFCDGV